MDPTLVNFINLGIGALFTWFGIFLSNKYSIRNQRELWDREHRTEREKWLRDQLQEIYSNCIYYLGNTPYASLNHNITPSNITYGTIRDASGLEVEKLKLEYEQLKLGIQQLEFDISKIYSEFNNEKKRWLNLLAVYYPFKDTSEFNDFLTKMREGRLSVEDVTELSARDPRLHSDIGKLSKR